MLHFRSLRSLVIESWPRFIKYCFTNFAWYYYSTIHSMTLWNEWTTRLEFQIQVWVVIALPLKCYHFRVDWTAWGGSYPFFDIVELIAGEDSDNGDESDKENADGEIEEVHVGLTNDMCFGRWKQRWMKWSFHSKESFPGQSHIPWASRHGFEQAKMAFNTTSKSIKDPGKEKSALGVGADVIVRLCDALPQQRNFKVFADHFFSGITIMIALKAKGIHY